MSSDDVIELSEDYPPVSLVTTGSAPGSEFLREPFEETHQNHQWYIVLTLLITTGAATIGVIVLALWGSDTAWTRLTSQLAFLLTPFHTMLGIAVGYYFATHPRKGGSSSLKAPKK